MNMKDIFTAIFIGLFVGFVLGVVYSENSTRTAEQKKAIAAKVGHWEVDEAGETKFVYGVNNSK